MDCETRRRYDRIRVHELLSEHPDWSNRRYAHEIGRDEKWVRDWKKRLKDQPLKQDYSIYQSRSRAPKRIWRKTAPEVEDVIVNLRQELSIQYYRPAGPNTILPYLRKREELKDAGYFVPTSASTIGRILKKRGCVIVRKPHIRMPLTLPAPMDEWEIDFGMIVLANGDRFEFLVVIDCGTSRVIHLEGSEGFNAETALIAMARVFILHGCPKILRFDRDSRFVGSWSRDSYSSAFVKFLKVLGIFPDVCPPRKPWKKPFVERCIYTIKYEWFKRHDIQTIADVFEHLSDFMDYYHGDRIHQGQACQGQTPNEAFPSLPVLPQVPDTVCPNQWLVYDHARIFRRSISSNGTIQIDRHTYYVGIDFAKQAVLVHLDTHNQRLIVMLEHEVIKLLDIKGLHDSEMDFQTYLVVMAHEARSTERHRHLLWMQYGEVA